MVLNLAQLLFIKESNQEANALLREALKLEIDNSARLEAQIYLLCHTTATPDDVAKATKELLKDGARLRECTAKYRFVALSRSS
jgi:hypothetical protein